MAYQIGIPYVLTGPLGQRVAFNDRADPDFVGFLDADDGVLGLDSPGVRSSGEDNVSADGGRTGPGFNSRRPISLKGFFDPGVPIEIVNERVDRTLDIIDSTARADATLLWQETGRTSTQLKLRRASEPKVGGRLPKTFLLSLVSEYDRIVSAIEKSRDFVTTASVSTGGYNFPLTFPLTSTNTAVGSQLLKNDGRKGAHPRFVIRGPITNPTIMNNTTGEQIVINYTLGDTDTMVIETRPGRRYCTVNGSNRWGAIDFASTRWFELGRGNSDVRLLAAASQVGASMTAYWRDTWIS